MMTDKISSEILRQDDARKIASSVLGTMPRTTASRFVGSDPRNLNLMTSSEIFLMNSPLIPDQLNITQSMNSVLGGLSTSLVNYMSDESLNLVPRDIMGRAVTNISRGIYDRVATEAAGFVASTIAGAYDAAKLISDFWESRGGDGGDGVASIFGPPSTKRGGTNGLQPVTLNGYSAVRQMGFDGEIGGYRAGDPRDHGKGLALDVMVHSDKRAGDIIADFFIKYREEYRVKYVIWYERDAGAYSNWQWTHYDAVKNTGSYSITTRHMDHPHISFNR